jgi:hypothetical protein
MRIALSGSELEEHLVAKSLHASVVTDGHAARIFDLHDACQIPGSRLMCWPAILLSQARLWRSPAWSGYRRTERT